MMRLPRMAAALAGAAAILTGCNDMKQIKHMPYPPDGAHRRDR